ncbi:MAG: helix-turn-helix transcriptional regulator [Deltaproteobacteria bacterium]|nr:helix-turn-helix transcriptional regulator [Deltaproteobacteria bacterium]
MYDRKQASAEFIQKLLAQSPMPRNQVAVISGLSNTYIRDLEQGIIANVARDKLIALAVALNLDLGQTDQMLNIFDRAPLSLQDIPIFLATAEKGTITSALLPVRDRYSLDLMMLAAERLPGPHVVVSSEPTVCLRAPGHRLYSERRLAETHPIYGELVETIGRERRQVMEKNLAQHPVEQYICKKCLEDYLLLCEDPVEKKWRVKHLRNVMACVERFAKWKFLLINSCPTFSFVLKAPDPSTGESDKLLITRLAPHRFQGTRTGKLTGFTTDNQVIIQNFKDELRGLAGAVHREYLDRNNLLDYLDNLIKE